MVPDDEAYLKTGKTPLVIEGLLSDPFQLDKIQKDIVFLKAGHKNSIRLGVIALIVSLLSLITAMLLNKTLWDLIWACFGKANSQ